jgi:ApbE superfamily uncharacterized protein (UPF0280 family)
MNAVAHQIPTTLTDRQTAHLSANRLHLHEGPIDLVIGAEGSPDAVSEAYRRAANRFDGLLASLVGELATLRTPIGDEPSEVFGPVAKRMIAAVRPHVGHFITPMAAVAGAVADEICATMSTVDEVRKIYVNDGGDIAFHLGTGESLAVGLVPVLVDAQLGGSVEISSDMSVRGIATSGMDGRSFSFGIADAVTVLASSAASADAAATLIANAVDADHPAIERVPASSLDPDSDLGDRLVTVERGSLPLETIDSALSQGEEFARRLLKRRLINAAFFSCEGHIRTVDDNYTNTIETFLS